MPGERKEKKNGRVVSSPQETGTTNASRVTIQQTVEKFVTRGEGKKNPRRRYQAKLGQIGGGVCAYDMN